MHGAKARDMRHIKGNHSQLASSDLQFPIRTCVGCGGKSPQRVMLRVASQARALPTLDLAFRAPGRGAYLCRRARCVEQAFKRRALERSLKLKQSAPGALKTELELALASGGVGQT